MVDLEATLRSSLDGRYVIESELGAGAMAMVFLAHDLKHDRRVAIKVLKPELASAIGGDRFQREIEVVAGLTHPHILPLYDSGEAAGLLYFVMPYIEGESLRARLKREGRLPIRDAIRITREIADALGFAHRSGVIHRDVKPGNILLTEDHARLADFGIAYLAETEGGTLTGTGLALGTPAYFSPEQATGDPGLDGRSDIYSLGCVLYEALTGQPPFTATSVRALITHHLVDAPPQVRELRPEVSEGTEAVVQTALRKEPEQRFQTAEEMAGSLDLISGGFEAIAAAALRKLIGPRHRWLHGMRLAAFALATVVALLGGYLALRSTQQQAGFPGSAATYAVLPFPGRAASEEDVYMSERAAEELIWHLIDWKSIKVVSGPVLEGPTAELMRAGFALPSVSLSSGQELLKQLNATHLIYVQARARRDSVDLLATMYARDAGTEDLQIPVSGPKSNLKLVTAPIALEILGLHDEMVPIDQLVTRSRNHLALQQFSEGRAALWDWRLGVAERHLRAAIDGDSTFALAHHYLAIAMYWRTVRDEERLLDGPSILHHVRRADRFGEEEGRLRPGERQHVDAFHSFWTGDYETARARYDTILEGNPLDLEALVLAGAVEYDDPWLVVERGTLRPRQDLDLARAVFDSAVSLTNVVQLAWGRLFDIDYYLARAAYELLCYGFHPPDSVMVPPYEIRDAFEQLYYCPYVRDGSIHWQADTLTDELRDQAIAGVRQRQRQTIELLEFWNAVEAGQARPHEELADWMLWERSMLGCGADSVWADSLAREARRHVETALAIRGDTTPEDRIRLGAVRLGAGEVSGAIEQTDQALRELGNWDDPDGPVPPIEAANPYMEAGRAHPAAEIVERSQTGATYAIPDSAMPEGVLAGGPVYGTLFSLRVLGILGGDQAVLRRQLSRLDRTWAEPRYTARQRALLRLDATSIVSPALVRLPDRWGSWFEDWDVYGLEIPAIWKGLLIAETEPEEARRHLEEAVREYEGRPPRRLRAVHFYMPIELAMRIGADSMAADLSARAAACPLAVNQVDFGWGMRDSLVGSGESEAEAP